MPARFSARGVGFEPDDGYAVVPFERPVDLYEEAFDRRLVEAGVTVMPSLLPSWLVARLARLAGHDARVFGDDVEVEADGLFIADVLALDEQDRVLAKLQLQAGPLGIGVLGVATSQAASKRCLEALVEALTSEPAVLSDAEVRVELADGGRVFRYGRRAGELIHPDRAATEVPTLPSGEGPR